jgi:hypothetical protein
VHVVDARVDVCAGWFHAAAEAALANASTRIDNRRTIRVIAF